MYVKTYMHISIYITMFVDSDVHLPFRPVPGDGLSAYSGLALAVPPRRTRFGPCIVVSRRAPGSHFGKHICPHKCSHGASILPNDLGLPTPTPAYAYACLRLRTPAYAYALACLRLPTPTPAYAYAWT